MTGLSQDLSGLAITKSERTILLALCVPPLVSLGTAVYRYLYAVSVEAKRQIEEENLAEEAVRQAEAHRAETEA